MLTCQRYNLNLEKEQINLLPKTRLHLSITIMSLRAIADVTSTLICRHCRASARLPSRNSCAAFFLFVFLRLKRRHNAIGSILLLCNDTCLTITSRKWNLLSPLPLSFFLGRQVTSVEHHDRLYAQGQHVIDVLHAVVHVSVKRQLIILTRALINVEASQVPKDAQQEAHFFKETRHRITTAWAGVYLR